MPVSGSVGLNGWWNFDTGAAATMTGIYQSSSSSMSASCRRLEFLIGGVRPPGLVMLRVG